jgi:aarF domain-containing kinase
LSIDDNYAIVQECYPYLARRLFTDRSPRAKKALRAMLGLSEEANEEDMMIASSPSSALAVVQAGAAQGKAPNRSPGALSPGKLVEMSEGFASYTAATTAVDKDGAGQLAAATEFSKLFFDPKGSTLQDILVDETARFGDAATRAALRASLVESVGAKAVASAMRAPKELLQQSPLYSILPGPLKAALIDRPAEFPQLVAALLASSQEDERILASAQELRDVLSTLSSRPSAVEDGHQASPISSSNANNLEQVTSLLSNESTRKMVVDQLPGVGALGRRVGAGLLRRAAYRTSKSILIPEEVRRRLVDANNAVADAIDLEEEAEK